MYEILNASINRRAALRRLSAVLGGIATAPLASGLLGGCTAPSGEEAAAYAYRSLDADQERTLAALVDQLIPATDTPGAAEAGVPQFVDTMLTDWYAPEERAGFLAGLAEVDARAQADHGAGFADLEPAAQLALLEALDAEFFGTAPEEEPVDGDVAESAQEGTYQASEQAEREVAGMQGDLGEAQSDAARRDSTGGATQINTGEGTATVAASGTPPPFYRQLKELTVAGYYTSQIGATQELRWNPAPGRYDPDVPFEEIGRAWA